MSGYGRPHHAGTSFLSRRRCGPGRLGWRRCIGAVDAAGTPTPRRCCPSRFRTALACMRSGGLVLPQSIDSAADLMPRMPASCSNANWCISFGARPGGKAPSRRIEITSAKQLAVILPARCRRPSPERCSAGAVIRQIQRKGCRLPSWEAGPAVVMRPAPVYRPRPRPLAGGIGFGVDGAGNGLQARQLVGRPRRRGRPHRCRSQALARSARRFSAGEFAADNLVQPVLAGASGHARRTAAVGWRPRIRRGSARG